MSALGDEFRAARETRGLTLSEVAAQIHIRTVYLQGIEDEDWTAIGAPVYIRGFIRTYARFLGLDAESAIARFNEQAPPAAVSSPVPVGGDRGRPSLLLGVGIALALVLLAGLAYSYYQLKAGNRAQASGAPAASVAPATTVTPATTATPAATAPPATPSPRPTMSPTSATAGTLRVSFSDRSWVRVAVDGRVMLEGIFSPGAERSFAGRRATVRAGNSSGVRLIVNGKDTGRLGGSGEVVERTLSLAGK